MGFYVLLGSLNNTNASNYKKKHKENKSNYVLSIKFYLSSRPKQKMISVVRAY